MAALDLASKSSVICRRPHYLKLGADLLADDGHPRTPRGSARHQQSFNSLEPEAGVALSLVDLDPRYALVP